MIWLHKHQCPNCGQHHFHEHDKLTGEDVTFKHRTCPVCVQARKVTMNQEYGRFGVEWAG